MSEERVNETGVSCLHFIVVNRSKSYQLLLSKEQIEGQGRGNEKERLGGFSLAVLLRAGLPLLTMGRAICQRDAIPSAFEAVFSALFGTPNRL